MVERADSSFGDDAGLDGSSEAEMLFTVLRGMWTKRSKKQTKQTMEDRESDDNGDELLAEKKKHRGKPKKMADRTQHEGKTERAKESHVRCSQLPGMRVLKIADLGTRALLVVNPFKLHLTAFIK